MTVWGYTSNATASTRIKGFIDSGAVKKLQKGRFKKLATAIQNTSKGTRESPLLHLLSKMFGGFEIIAYLCNMKTKNLYMNIEEL